MGDSFHSHGSSKNSEVTSVITCKKVSKRCLVASSLKSFSQKSLRHVASFNHGKMGREAAGHAVLFLLKVAALETIRRFSRARCPFVWSGLQALQVFCYPPFKWIQRWAPFKGLVNGVQILSRPLLVLSIATAFSDQLGCDNVTSDDTEDSHGLNDSHSFSESHSELPSVQSTSDTRILGEAPQSLSSENWLLQLYTELKNQGISLPERINEDELHRIYTAANGDFSCLLSSVKKTIHWRETYNILSGQELETWSNMVFWHGFDVKHRPCLIVRLGLACITLPSHDRPRFAQAVVSQVEHGIVHLVDCENRQITVLVDCEGLTPLRFPMQMMRSCSALLQDHFPNRLGCLFVIRLPPVVRVIAQTFIQVLKPVTRQKLKIKGEMYQMDLTEYLQTLPSCLGGTCTCTRCSNLSICDLQEPQINEDTNMTEMIAKFNNDEDLPSPHPSCLTDMHMNGNCDQVLRTAMVGILILWVLIAFIAGICDPESRPVLPL
uniref:CRAL-TRIO domain-containing protein n=1 Tax=Davidia involucrata TaxID=16924 RepID=A0A5B7C3A5_DAVIN